MQVDALFELLPDAVLVVDADGLIRQQNPAAISIIGNRLGDRIASVFQPFGPEQPIGRSVRRLVHDVRIGHQSIDVNRRPLPGGGAIVTFRPATGDPDPMIAALSQYATLAITDATGEFLYVNDSLCTLTGFTRDELIGQHTSKLSAVDTPVDAFGEMSDAQRSGRVWRGEVRWRRRDGGTFWTHTTVMPFLDSDGQTRRVMMVLDDITDQKRIEESVRNQHDQFRKAFQANPIAMTINRFEDGTFVDVNEAFCRLVCRDRSAIVGKREQDLMFNRVNHSPEAFRRFAQDRGSVRDLEITFDLADGSHREVLGSFETITVGDEQLGLSLLIDVSARQKSVAAVRRSEEVYRTLARHLPNGLVLLFDTKRRLVVADGSELAQAGMSRSDVEGRTLEEVMPLKDRSGANAQFLAALRGVATTTERRIGEAVYAVHTHPVRGDNGAIDGVLMLSQNITSTKQHETALAAANAELMSKVAELEQRNSQISLLADLGEALQRCLALDDAYQAIGEFVPYFFPRQSGMAIMLAAGAMQQIAGWGDDLPIFGPDDCWALVSGRTLVMDSHGPTCPHALATPALSVPIQGRDEVLGVLHLVGPVDRSTVQLATTIAEHVALSLVNLRMRETLHNQSIRDALTGLFNRRYLDEILPRELSRADRASQTLAVLMLDLDLFKSMNDRFGHDAGDQLLRVFGDFLRIHIRSGDIACRYGGEEFLIVSPASGAADAVLLAERIRNAVKSLRVQHRGSDLPPITVSVGISIYPEHGENGRRLVSRADGALYRAKAEGRDRVVLVDGRTGMTVA